MKLKTNEAIAKPRPPRVGSARRADRGGRGATALPGFAIASNMSARIAWAVFAVCAGSCAAGAAGVRVLDCEGRVFASPTCMTEERIFKVADKELMNGGVKVLSLDLRIQKCAKAALEKHVDAKNIEFATAFPRREP